MFCGHVSVVVYRLIYQPTAARALKSRGLELSALAFSHLS